MVECGERCLAFASQREKVRVSDLLVAKQFPKGSANTGRRQTAQIYLKRIGNHCAEQRGAVGGILRVGWI